MGGLIKIDKIKSDTFARDSWRDIAEIESVGQI